MTAPTAPRQIEYHEFTGLKQDVTDMKSLMSRMVETMSRITVIEERQHAASEATNKALERMEQITERQHAYELANAGNTSVVSQVGRIETVIRELHVESERNKARFGTVVWMVRGLWAIVGLTVGSGGLIWITHALTIAPIK